MFTKLDLFLQEDEDNDEVLITGGIDDVRIADIEKTLNIILCAEMKDFLSNYGYLIGYGLEIYGWGKGDTSNLIKNTLRRREEGLKDDMLVINDIGELVYCVDNSNGKVVSWDVSNGDYAEEALDLETYIIEQLEEGKDNW